MTDGGLVKIQSPPTRSVSGGDDCSKAIRAATERVGSSLNGSRADSGTDDSAIPMDQFVPVDTPNDECSFDVDGPIASLLREFEGGVDDEASAMLLQTATTALDCSPTVIPANGKSSPPYRSVLLPSCVSSDPLGLEPSSAEVQTFLQVSRPILISAI